ncbi:hypothetical protein QZH63_07760 [Eikenella corrodens]|nr:hypothetical protein [Eikenella corrodens]MDN8581898.1 hypothetical protein [Eikenella corrodens]
MALIAARPPETYAGFAETSPLFSGSPSCGKRLPENVTLYFKHHLPKTRP